MKTKSKIPALRFKGFTDAWEQRKLIDYLEVSKEKNKNEVFGKEDVLSVSGDYGIVNQIEFQGRSFAGASVAPYGIVDTGDIVYTKSPLKSNPYGIIKANKGKTGIVSTLYAVYKPLDNVCSDFVQIYFEQDARMNNYMRPLVNKGAKNDMKVSDVNALKGEVCFPSKYEQIKISEHFAKLDRLIALHQRKCDQTKELKKTMLQKMFPKKGERIPEIRFPEFTDEWEEKKLGEMLTERNVQQVPKEDAPLVSFTVENGVTPKTDRYDREFLVRTGDKKYKYTTFDDIVYNPANLKFGAIARNKFGDAVFSPIYVTLVADKEKVLPIFIERIVTNGNFIQESLRYQEGTVYERMSVKVPDFLSMKISIPSLPEQEAIGTYFQTLDQDIAQIEKKLADLKELKKALLRQLFV